MKFTIWSTYWILLVQRCRMVSLSEICNPVVQVEQGLVKGTCMSTLHGDRIYAFRGIPFGKPPVGNLRFQAPQPAEPWKGILDASKDSKMCPQLFSEYKMAYVGDEDCLRLYVFSYPIAKNASLLPVIVTIHGGSTMKGSASYIDFHPQRYMSNKALPVIIVAIQYRLSILGFFSTGDAASPGNYAGLDQILAMQWVQKNIDKFGGDPRRVTIVGDSVGGISALNTLVSPTANGLFRAIATFSGSLWTRIFIQDDPLAIAKQLGKSVQCQSDNTTDLVDCLRGKTAKELIIAAHLLSITSGEFFPFLPVVENPKTGKYLKDRPETLFSKGQFIKVPIIMGSTKDETSPLILYKYVNFLEYLPMIPSLVAEVLVFNIMIPLLAYLFGKCQTNLHALSYAIKQNYEDDYDYRDKKQLAQFMVDMTTDGTFRLGTDKLARMIAAQDVPVYLYSFEYHGDVSNITSFGNKEVGHIENFHYFEAEHLNEKDNNMSRILLTQLQNFVYYLDPSPGQTSPKWLPTSADRELQYLKYGDDDIAMKKGYYTKKMNFWKTQIPKIIQEKRLNGSPVSGLHWA